MENAICCVNGRFCWKKSDFPGWEKIIEFGKPFCRMSYHGWTSLMLVGHNERYLEVWQHNNKRELFFSNVGVWYQDTRQTILRRRWAQKTECLQVFGWRGQISPAFF